MKRKCVLPLIILLIYAYAACGQNINFTQYFNFPLYSDPSQTGSGAYDYRLNMLYRQQWKTIDAEFNTFALSGDVRMGNIFSKQDYWGVGAYLLDDHLGSDLMQNQQMGLALAFHFNPDFQARHKVSLGINLDYTFSTVDYSSLIFESQYQGFLLDPEMVSGENFVNDRIKNLDFGAGVSYSLLLSPKVKMGASFSSFGIIPEQEHFISESDSNRYKHTEWLARGFYSYRISPKVRIGSQVQIISQSNASEIMFGTIGYYTPFLAKQLTISMGAFRQFKVAHVVYGGVSFKNYAINVSYDFVSQPLNMLREINGLSRPGGTEITLSFKGFKAGRSAIRTVPCRFF